MRVIHLAVNLLGLSAELLQICIIDGLTRPSSVSIAVLVNQILSLAFSCPQDIIAEIFE